MDTMPKKPIRILFDAHALLGKKTGVGYYVDQLISELARQHVDDVEIVGYYHNFLYRKHISGLPAGPNIRYRQVAFMPGQVVNLLRRFHILLPVELLTLTKADFILYPNYLGLASLFKTPSASVVHDLSFIDLPEYLSERNLHDLQSFMPAQIARSTFLVAVSEFTKTRIRQEFDVPAEAILVTPAAPDTPLSIPVATRRHILDELGVHGNYILTLGTVEPRKNLPNMLAAYLQLPKKLRQEYTFVVAGKIGWKCEQEVAELKRLKQAGENVLHLGYVTDEQRASLFANATFFTSASHYEGFGMPALEAMSYGTACAMSDIAVFHEAGGSASRYFNQEDPTSIAKTWEALLNNPLQLKKLAVAGKRRADSYSWKAVADSLYERIVKTLTEEKS